MGHQHPAQATDAGEHLRKNVRHRGEPSVGGTRMDHHHSHRGVYHRLPGTWPDALNEPRGPRYSFGRDVAPSAVSSNHHLAGRACGAYWSEASLPSKVRRDAPAQIGLHDIDRLARIDGHEPELLGQAVVLTNQP